MKVLFVTAKTRDMSAGFLWDGLRTVLGEDAVDAVDSPYLRGADIDSEHIVGRAVNHRTLRDDEDDFDILVATTTFLRDHDWYWLQALHDQRVKAGGKLVYFETLDSPLEIYAPPFDVDAIFRREIDPSVVYPYGKPLQLSCAIPKRWFDDPVYGWTDQKKWDVFCVSNCVPTGFPARWDSNRFLFSTPFKHSSLAGDACLVLDEYLAIKRRFKLVVCAPGGGVSCDFPRIWETIAMGGVPIFVGFPCRVHYPWFSDSDIFWCEEARDLGLFVERALKSDLQGMRLRMREHALAMHTTEARATQFLHLIEMNSWKNWECAPYCW